MKNINKYLTFTTQQNYIGLFVFFFVIGTVWGKFFYYNEENRSALFKKSTLNLLAEEGFLPDDVTESFAIENGLHLQITTYKNKEDLITQLTNKRIDLVAFKSFYAQDVMKDLSKITYNSIKNKELISVDFKNPPYDPENKFAVPLFWGIEKKGSAEKSLLWIESIGIVKNSNRKKEAHEFLDYILQSDVILQVISLKKVASTNRSIERAKNIEFNLKPSYLRKISIRNLAFADRARF
ncbi:MAG: hypothetical protein V4596_03880 [Bdellovibrionota bacterium]